jgi:hypothetical protein
MNTCERYLGRDDASGIGKHFPDLNVDLVYLGIFSKGKFLLFRFGLGLECLIANKLAGSTDAGIRACRLGPRYPSLSEWPMIFEQVRNTSCSLEHSFVADQIKVQISTQLLNDSSHLDGSLKPHL